MSIPFCIPNLIPRIYRCGHDSRARRDVIDSTVVYRRDLGFPYKIIFAAAELLHFAFAFQIDALVHNGNRRAHLPLPVFEFVVQLHVVFARFTDEPDFRFK